MYQPPIIRLVFTSRDTFVSKAIRFFSGSRISHVGIVIPWEGEDQLLHATTGGPRGVQLQTLKSWLDSGAYIVAEYVVVAPIHEKIAHLVEKELGVPYDKAGLVGYMFVMAMRRLGRKHLTNPLASSAKVVCSEFVLALDPAGALIPEWAGLDPEATTPEDLVRICHKSRAFLCVKDTRGKKRKAAGG